MSPYTPVWILWIAMFFAIEGPALANKTPGDTLSEHLRGWFATTGKPRWWIIRRGILGSFFVWFIPHICRPWFEPYALAAILAMWALYAVRSRRSA